MFTLVVAQATKAGPSTWNNDALMTYLYYKPWTRAGPYLIGVLVGILYWEYKNQDSNPALENALGTRIFNSIKNNRIVRYGCFIFGWGFVNLFIFGPAEENSTFGQ